MKKDFIIIIISIVGIIAIIVFGSRFYAGNNSSDSYKDDGDTDTALFDDGLDAQINNEGEVIIAVTPVDQINWSFEVVMNTHSVELSEDLTQVSVLVDENGNEHKPVEWRGDPLGGHHRAGTLIFGKIAPAPKSVTLIIRQISGIAERKFEWVLKNRN